MSRIANFSIALILLIFLLIPILIIGLILLFSSKDPIFYWSDRVGKNSIIFSMPKFRTMHLNTPEVATHSLKNPDVFVTRVGSFLRKTSLDELPQIWSVLMGEMNLVGPRPALFNQQDLIELRINEGVHKLVPGITGWAQVNGRDELSLSDKVKLDVEYMSQKSFFFDIKIIWMTLFKSLSQDKISH
jgi:O-antigen biosynthesis protein WbqP